MKPRIALVTDHIPPYRVTFYEKLCARFDAEWLVIHGDKTVEDGRPSHTGALGFPHVRVTNKEAFVGPYMIRWQAGALREVARFNPDAVVVVGITGILSNWLIMGWAGLNGKRRIVWSCGWESQRPGSLALGFKHFLVRRYLSCADLHLVYGTKAKHYLGRLGVPEAKIVVCYNGIETDHLLDGESTVLCEARRLRSPHELPIFLFVGALAPDKRVDLLLDAWEILTHQGNECSLWIVGDGPMKAQLVEKADRLRTGNIEFRGRIVDEVDALFAVADYVVLPGTGGLALNQALFWRVPCIVGEADGTEEDLIVDGLTGFRFEAGDAESLARAMARAFALPAEDRLAMGVRGRRLVETRSNVNEMVSTFSRSLEKTLSASGGGEERWATE